jgi:hypothetical protein
LKAVAAGIATPIETTSKRNSKTTKLAVMLGLLISGVSLNRFEAERHHDHCLNTTVSTLHNYHGIKIKRQRETVPCVRGTSWVSVKRYWLDTDPENIQRARGLLAAMKGQTP